MGSQNDYKFNAYQYSQYHHSDIHQNGCDLHYLALLVKGSAQIVTSTQTLDIRQGDVFYIPRGLCYDSYWYGDPQIEFLSFGFLTMPIADQKGYLLQKIPHADGLASMLKSIPIQGPQVSSHALSLFYAALAEATTLMSHNDLSLAHRIADQAMSYIRRQPNAQIADIAQICGISQAHLYTVFRNTTGTTPNKYRKRILCSLAVELLTTTSLTVEEISDKLNFSSPSYFRKVIHQITGLTPRQIRAQADPFYGE